MSICLIYINLKFSKPDFKYMNCEPPDVQAGLEKAEEPEIKLPTCVGSSKQESSRKTSISALLTMPKTDCVDVDHNKLFKRWEYQTTLPALYRSRSNS